MPALRLAVTRRGASGAAAALAALVVLTVIVALGLTDHIDRRLLAGADGRGGEVVQALCRVVSLLGSAEASILVIVALGLVAAIRAGSRRRLQPTTIVAGAALAVGGVVELVLKNLLRHTPPGTKVHDEGLVLIVTQSSYPSGHAFRSLVLATLMTALVARPWRRRVALGGALVVAAIATARLVLATHWPSDILGGFLLGGAAAPFLLATAAACASAPGAGGERGDGEVAAEVPLARAAGARSRR